MSSLFNVGDFVTASEAPSAPLYRIKAITADDGRIALLEQHDGKAWSEVGSCHLMYLSKAPAAKIRSVLGTNNARAKRVGP